MLKTLPFQFADRAAGAAADAWGRFGMTTTIITTTTRFRGASG